MRYLLPNDLSLKGAQVQSGGTAINPGLQSGPAVDEWSRKFSMMVLKIGGSCE
jgi:hypothetical protein